MAKLEMKPGSIRVNYSGLQKFIEEKAKKNPEAAIWGAKLMQLGAEKERKEHGKLTDWRKNQTDSAKSREGKFTKEIWQQVFDLNDSLELHSFNARAKHIRSQLLKSFSECEVPSQRQIRDRLSKKVEKVGGE